MCADKIPRARDDLRIMTTTTPFLRLIPFFVTSALVVGCSTAPKTSAERTELKDEAQITLKRFKSQDSTLDGVLSRSTGYAVFPTIGKGGLIAGAAYGRGTVYEGGKQIGYADMSQGSVGAQIGGESYSELIVFQTPEALYKFKNNNFTFGANATAVALKAGAAAGTEFKDGVAIFLETKGGLMADASLAGQKFTFVPDSVATDQAPTMKTTETTETKTTTVR
jgi:lipid-binding SYLF domain-containing protein